jgi:hypothetical protein
VLPMYISYGPAADAEAQQLANKSHCFLTYQLQQVKWCILISRNKMRKHFEQAFELVFSTKSQCGSKTGICTRPCMFAERADCRDVFDFLNLAV